jgi:hypothetical protein
MPIIKTIYGDLLDFPVIAHCISVDAAMGAGLALQITKNYPLLPGQIRAKRLSPGEIFIYKDEKQTIFNLCTKRFYWQHIGSGISNEEYLKNLKTGLELVFKYLVEKKLQTLWIPRLGCGLDRGYWPEIEALFAATELKIILVEKKDGK